MTADSDGMQKTLLPMSRPWWIAVLMMMVSFGYLQEDVKIKLNHYLSVGDRYLDFYTLEGEECEWKSRCMYFARKDWWSQFSPTSSNNFYITRDTFDVFHWWDRDQLVRFKWMLMVGIVLGFFMLDSLFLHSVGVGNRWRLLFLIYAGSGLLVAIFYLLDGKSGSDGPGYNVAREVLGFLQSPMPSLFLVLLPWLRDRSMSNNHIEGL